MIIELIEKSLKKIEAELEVIFVFNKDLDAKNIKDKELLEKVGFKADDEESALFVELNKLYIGCSEIDLDLIRVASATAVKKIKATNYKSAKFQINSDEKEFAAYIDGLLLGEYKFDKYKSKKDDKKDLTINISCDFDTKKVKKILKERVSVCEGVNRVRDIVNTTPDDFYPSIMANVAIDISKENELECQIFDEDYLYENGMNAMLAVARASRHKPKLIHLTYKPKNPKCKVVLVGKGLTYDSGGLSLKPSEFMVSMKSDKSGGSAVLGIMSILSKLKLDIEVHGIVGAVENMIGGDAYKPDDVLYAKNGTTIEVRNTDAEGRLVLADCLCYAQDEIKDIDYIFDYATLTGACVVGVGEYTSGVMGHNEDLKSKITESAADAGEYATALHFNRYLKKTIKSEIADICNIANTRYGGAITAGHFLDNFIYDENKEKWAHIDIAGPAFVEKAWGYNPHGASGAGVRLTIEFLKSL